VIKDPIPRASLLRGGEIFRATRELKSKVGGEEHKPAAHLAPERYGY